MADLAIGDGAARRPDGPRKGPEKLAPGQPNLRPRASWLIFFLGLMAVNYLLTRMFLPEPACERESPAHLAPERPSSWSMEW
jgi:hypothetical protein